MRDACIKATEAALKRPLNVAEARDIEGRVRNAMTQAARADVAKWRTLSPSQRLTEGGKLAAQELEAEAAKKKQRLGDAILLKAHNERFLNDQVAAGYDPHKVAALQRLLVAKYDDKNNTQSVESAANGFFGSAVAELDAVFDAIRPGLRRLIPWTDPTVQRQMRSALAGVTHNVEPVFVKAAAAFHKIAEEYREMFNAAGGAVGKLENWDQPHIWSRRLANKVGRDKFVADFMTFVDRSKYVDLNGRAFTDDEMREFLEEAWLTIASEGMSKEAQLLPGGSVKANRHRQHRTLLLKPEVTASALEAYSEKNVLESMTDHLRQMSRDIALVQRFGPNADHQFMALLEEAKTEAVRADPAISGKIDSQARYITALYDHLAGNNNIPANQSLADAASVYRSSKTAALLGSAVITSISDMSTLYMTAINNGLNPFKVMMNSSLIWSPKSRKYVKRMGLMIDAVVGYASRYGSENLTARDIGSRVASWSVNASGLGFVTEARRLGFSVTMMDSIGSLARRVKDVTKLAQADKRILAAKGIDQKTWDIWRMAKLDKWGANHTLLTPETIMGIADPSVSQEAKRRAVAALLGIVQEEQDIAIIQPGVRERVQMTFGTDRGTFLGELARSALLFKSFPWTMFQRHMERAVNQPGNLQKYAYMAGLLVTMTMLGVAANFLNDLLSGKNPRTLNPNSDYGPRNLIAGAMKGGALGVYGDFLFSELSPYSNTSLAETLAGPLVADVSKLGQMGSQIIKGVAEDDEEQFQKAGAGAVKFARGFTPGANTWYSKAVTDRYIFNALTEQIDPDYLDELEDRQESTAGTSYWWGLDDQAGLDGSSIGAPDFEAVAAD